MNLEDEIKYLSIQKRLKAMKPFEDANKERLKKYFSSVGLEYRDATAKEDIKDKIDCYLVNPKKNKEFSIQLKQRTKGYNDILMEVYSDFDVPYSDNQQFARDIVGKAELYGVINSVGRFKLFAAEPIKDLVLSTLAEVPEETYQEFKNSYQTGIMWKKPHIELNVSKSTGKSGEGFRKLIAYIDFDVPINHKVVP